MPEVGLETPTTPWRGLSSSLNASPSRPLRPPFMHPNVSRLRSFIPKDRSRFPSSSTANTFQTNGFSPDPSHFSAISRASSVSGHFEVIGHSNHEGESPNASTSNTLDEKREVFKWTPLRAISAQIYSTMRRVVAALDTHMGKPTVISAQGVICIGTQTGRTFVFDFRQQLKCMCSSESTSAYIPNHLVTYLFMHPNSIQALFRHLLYRMTIPSWPSAIFRVTLLYLTYLGLTLRRDLWRPLTWHR